MPSYNTPGVYIQEIAKLPASIAPVATAIPAFIGYTEKDGGGAFNMKAVRITSMLDYEEKFGGPYREFFLAKLSDTGIEIAYLAGGEVSPYLLYYQLRMFFVNGGGPCYIVSVGTFATSGFLSDLPDDLPGSSDLPTSADISESSLRDGVDACEKEDEITLLAVPEAILLNQSGRENVNTRMLDQCAALQDRFAVLDAYTDLADSSASVITEGANFRDDVPAGNLKYGAAYYPALNTSLGYAYNEEWIEIEDNRTDAIYDEERLTSLLSGEKYDSPGTKLGKKAKGIIKITGFDKLENDRFNINGVIVTVIASGTPGAGEILSDPGTGSNGDTAGELADFINDPVNGLDTDFTASVQNTNEVHIEADRLGAWANNLKLEYWDSDGDPGAEATQPFQGGVDGINKSLYNQVKAALAAKTVALHPCGAIAGVYARIDRERGVWKAPANTSLRSVLSPFRQVTDSEQGSLNIDAGSGKSINAIRIFAGKGTLVWGARTLAGNDNEWRYVPVRRLFIFMEESIKKATEHVVFEANDGNTWNRVKGMIQNFLTGLWRQGALAGAKPEDAFFVNIGLGSTMSEDDILNGIMNIEIGVAAVRPAEFIILKFSHKLQQA